MTTKHHAPPKKPHTVHKGKPAVKHYDEETKEIAVSEPPKAKAKPEAKHHDPDRPKLEALLKAIQEYKVCPSSSFDLNELEASITHKLADMK